MAADGDIVGVEIWTDGRRTDAADRVDAGAARAWAQERRAEFFAAGWWG